MRVLFLSLDTAQGVGGIQRFNRRLVRALGELSVRGAVEEAYSLSLWDKTAVRELSGVRHRGFGRRKGMFVAGLVSTLGRFRPDVVMYGHVLLVRLLPVAKVVRPRAAQVLIVHGWEVWGDPRYRRVPWWERKVASAVDAVFAVSQTTAGRMSRAYGMPEERFFLLPNAVDLPSAVWEPRERSGQELRVLTVSRLSSTDTYKGVDLVVRAVARVGREVPVTCTVVGDGELRRGLEREAGRLGARELVRFVGQVDDQELDRWYRWADVFVLPSTGEGFGIVYLEAWAYGLPVVGAAEGGAAEVITDGQTGLLVEAGSTDSLADAILKLARDPALRMRLGAAGRALVQARFTHEHFRRRLEDRLAVVNRRPCAASLES